MKIENLQSPSFERNVEKTIKSGETGFADLLKKAINEVNQLQKRADLMAEKFAVGEIDNIHNVTIASEQAKLALELTLAVRNKVVEAYKEIMRMQF
ncbi:flagellar hook-basal body complex protein FliE [Anoxybacter fermentans]|uniref:Flagellar hook-basal body complex protein FliE n=1 Tax=Anoxybacter fermentans TaxID=1323375 RepID=A0A3Q9HRV4_9FIRM|nr:flagellar hook-basal body complex protein FliE [Anoxybacter fermentans]AZR73882.1 flagellar hook-basal body complex protein FliE [Anoxybacter fermentans]